MSGWIFPKDKWMRWYAKIISSLNLNFSADQEATDLLSRILTTMEGAMTFDELKNVMSGLRGVVVVGAGPSLEKSDQKIRELKLKGWGVFSADGATTFLLEHNITPDIVVTDLDGRIRDLLSANERGSIAVIHAHGDNIPAIKEFVKKFKGRIMGSTQVEPRPLVYNFGGFTDGDRCVFLAYALGYRRIALAGMDFGNVVGRYSKPWLSSNTPANAVKRKKMDIARDLIEWLAKSEGLEILTV